MASNHCPVFLRAARATSRQGSYIPVLRSKRKGIPQTKVCRILDFMHEVVSAPGFSRPAFGKKQPFKAAEAAVAMPGLSPREAISLPIKEPALNPPPGSPATYLCG